MLTALFHLVAAALVISGLGKLWKPQPSAQAMRDAGFPALVGRARAIPGLGLGVAEIVIGASALLLVGPVTAAALSTAYLGFASFLLLLRSRDETAGCGCFGSSSAPPGRAHLAVNLVAAAVAASAAVVEVDALSTVMADGATVAVPYAALLLTGSALLLSGPSLFADQRAARSTPAHRTFAIDAGPVRRARGS